MVLDLTESETVPHFTFDALSWREPASSDKKFEQQALWITPVRICESSVRACAGSRAV
jgi:hypothetical protein